MLHISVKVRTKNTLNPTAPTDPAKTLQKFTVAVDPAQKIRDVKRVPILAGAKVDSLFTVHGRPLSDEKTIGYYPEIQDSSIVETVSNPKWVAFLYTIAAEQSQLLDERHNAFCEYDEHDYETDNIQGTAAQIEKEKKRRKKEAKKEKTRRRKDMNDVKARKMRCYQMIGVLTNSKKKDAAPPARQDSLDELAELILQKCRGSFLSGKVTSKRMKELVEDYDAIERTGVSDPVMEFVVRHRARLLMDRAGPAQQPRPRNLKKLVAIKPKIQRRRQPMCVDCGTEIASLRCLDCPDRLVLCQDCSDALHRGVTRRNHRLENIARNIQKATEYIPQPLHSSFAILIGLYTASVVRANPQHSLDETECKLAGQPYTYTDLQFRNVGAFAGFDTVERILIEKKLVVKEATRPPRYSLTPAGRETAQRCWGYHEAFHQMAVARSIRMSFPVDLAASRHDENEVVLLIDSREQEGEKILAAVRERGIRAYIRKLPAGDFLWVRRLRELGELEGHDGADTSELEYVLPHVVERKTYDDLSDSLNDGRYENQRKRMFNSGLRDVVYIIEGISDKMRGNFHTPQELEDKAADLQFSHSILVNYTTSLKNTAELLVDMTHIVEENYRRVPEMDCMSLASLGRQCRTNIPDQNRLIFSWRMWSADSFIGLLQDANALDKIEARLAAEFGQLPRVDNCVVFRRHLLIIQGLGDFLRMRKRLNIMLHTQYHSCQTDAERRRLFDEELDPRREKMLVSYESIVQAMVYIQFRLGISVRRIDSPEDENMVMDRVAWLFNGDSDDSGIEDVTEELRRRDVRADSLRRGLLGPAANRDVIYLVDSDDDDDDDSGDDVRFIAVTPRASAGSVRRTIHAPIDDADEQLRAIKRSDSDVARSLHLELNRPSSTSISAHSARVQAQVQASELANRDAEIARQLQEEWGGYPKASFHHFNDDEALARALQEEEDLASPKHLNRNAAMETSDAELALRLHQEESLYGANNPSLAGAKTPAKRRHADVAFDLHPSPKRGSRCGLVKPEALADITADKAMTPNAPEKVRRGLGEGVQKNTAKGVITCGLCGNTGHTRSMPVCPMFNDPEEIRRRANKMAQRAINMQRKRQEDEAREREEAARTREAVRMKEIEIQRVRAEAARLEAEKELLQQGQKTNKAKGRAPR